MHKASYVQLQYLFSMAKPYFGTTARLQSIVTLIFLRPNVHHYNMHDNLRGSTD